jgi:hypothetical protein
MMARSRDARHNVYVILLKPDAARHSKVVQQNPKRDRSRPCVYVGMTGLTVDQRFLNHKNGYKSSWVVKRYGDRLLPEELYEHLNPMPYEAAVEMEKDLAEGPAKSRLHRHRGSLNHHHRCQDSWLTHSFSILELEYQINDNS